MNLFVSENSETTETVNDLFLRSLAFRINAFGDHFVGNLVSGYVNRKFAESGSVLPYMSDRVLPIRNMPSIQLVVKPVLVGSSVINVLTAHTS